jgi:hypothetical protein
MHLRYSDHLKRISQVIYKNQPGKGQVPPRRSAKKLIKNLNDPRGFSLNV